MKVRQRLGLTFILHLAAIFAIFQKERARMANYSMYLDAVIRGYHAYLHEYTLTLGEILTVESDPEAVQYDKFAMKFMTPQEKIGGHIPKHFSQLCFKFVDDGGELDAEVIGKRFNAGEGKGVEVPVELRFTGNKKYLENLRGELCSVVEMEHLRQENVKPTKLKAKLPTDVTAD